MPAGPNKAGHSSARPILHWTYLEIARSALGSSRTAEKMERVLLDRHGSAKSPAENEDLFWAEAATGQQKSQQAIVAIVFAVLTLEDYINSIAHQRLSHFYRNTFDRLDLPGKWVVIPQMAFGDGPEPGEELIARIRRLQKDRNALVHSHPTYGHGPDLHELESAQFWKEASDKHQVRPEKAEAAIKTCLDAVEAIHEIAPDFDPDYKTYATWRDSATRKMAIATNRLTR